MSLRQEAVKGVVWSAAQKWGVRLISALVMIILPRLVMPESFGLVAYAVVFTSFAQLFVDQGFSDAIVQFPNLEREHLDTAFWIGVFAGTALTVGFILAAGQIATLFHKPELAPVLRWLSPIFILSALSSVQQSYLRRNFAFRSLTIRSLISTVASSVVALTMAFLGCGVWSLVAKLLVDGAVNVIALWQVTDWKPSFHLSTRHFKQLFSYGINILGGNFVDWLSVHSDDFLIGYFLGDLALGYYTLGYNLLIILTDLLVSVPNLVAFPVFSKIQNEPERLKNAFFEVTQLQSLIAFPVFLGIAAVAPEAIRVIYTEEWAASIPVIQILMLIGIVRSAVYFYSSIFRAAGKPSWRFGLYALTALLNVIGFLVVVRMGIVAVAISYVCVSYLLMPLYFFLIQKIVHITALSHLQQYLPAFAGSVAMIGTVLILKHFLGENFTMLIRMIMEIISGALAYFLAIRIIRPELYTKMIELAQMAIPKSIARQKLGRG
jgi:O-antigen/teichoic acid export membrane protein